MMMQNFEPFYVYAQSLDNLSDDLMYKISDQSSIVAEKIDGLPVAQSIMQNIHQVAISNNLKNQLGRVAKQINTTNKVNLPDVYVKGNQVVLKVKTNDVDNHGRQSPILVFLTLPHNKDYNGYINYLSEGFTEFCKVTGRNPKDDAVNFIKTLPLDILLQNKSTPLFSPKVKKYCSLRWHVL